MSSFFAVHQMLAIQNEAAFAQAMSADLLDRIPALLVDGLSVDMVPGFFQELDRFRIAVTRRWFEAIVDGDVAAIQRQQQTFGIPIDLAVPRKLLKQLLATDFEHLHGLKLYSFKLQ